MKESDSESEEPPGHGRPSYSWEEVPPAQWNDWCWQLAHWLNTVDELAQIIRLTPEEVAGLAAPGHFRVDITPYFASLMDPDDPDCPIRRQIVPTSHELVPFEAEMADSLAEDATPLCQGWYIVIPTAC